MPAFIAMIWGAFLGILPSLVGKVLISLGVGVATYTGISSAIGFLKSSAVSAVMNLPPDAVGMLSTMKVGQCISIIFSAMTMRLVLNGLTGDTFKRWVTK